MYRLIAAYVTLTSKVHFASPFCLICGQSRVILTGIRRDVELGGRSVRRHESTACRCRHDEIYANINFRR